MADRPVHLIFLGGFGGFVPPFYYSNGLKECATRLMKLSASVKTTTLHHNQEASAYETALQANKLGASICLSGHSLGAEAVLRIAARLAAVGVQVGLIFVFDLTWNMWLFRPRVGSNVSRAIAVYNTSFSFLGKGKLYPARNFEGHLANIPLAVLHQNIDDDLSAHAMLEREVKYLLGHK